MEAQNVFDINFTYPCTSFQSNPTVTIGSQSQMRSSQGCNISKQPNQSDNLNEHVGFNEEGLYVGVCKRSVRFKPK
jgi:hypothetical protein